METKYRLLFGLGGSEFACLVYNTHMAGRETLAPQVASFLNKSDRITNRFEVPRRENLPSELVSVAETVASISSSWNPVEIYTAEGKSREQEKQKFLQAFDRGEVHNPTFTYSHAELLNLGNSRERLEEQLATVRKFKPQDRVTRLARAALYFKIKDDLATADLVAGIQSRDDKKNARALKQKYLGTDPALMQLAEEIYAKLTYEGVADEQEGQGLLSSDEKEYLRGKTYDAQDIKEAYEFILSRYGILRTDGNSHGFKVKIDPDASSVDVRDKASEPMTVYIPHDRKMNGITLLTTSAHEIEGHAIQGVSGLELFGIGGGPLRIDDEQLYEGYGLRRETEMKKKLLGVEDVGPRPFYPLAVKMAEEGGSFYEIFSDQLRRHLRVALRKPTDEELPQPDAINPRTLETAKNNAWLVTYRVMRGHIDMSNKEGYAMAKDLGYMRGFQMDSQLQDHGHGHINESGIIAPKALQIIAELNLSADSLPLPFIDATTAYWQEVLKPSMLKEQSTP